MIQITYGIQHRTLGYFRPDRDGSLTWNDCDFTSSQCYATKYSVHGNCVERLIELSKTYDPEDFKIVEFHTHIAVTRAATDALNKVINAKRRYVDKCDAMEDDEFERISDKEFKEYRAAKRLVREWDQRNK